LFFFCGCFGLFGLPEIVLRRSVQMPRRIKSERVRAYCVIDDPDHKTAAGAYSDVCFFILEVGKANLKSVATRARVMVDLQRLVKGHVLDFDLVVNCDVLLAVRHPFVIAEGDGL
jgi:hypothetical protein